MPALTFSLQPQEVPHVDTAYRKIQTPLPVPDSVPFFENYYNCEPEAMGGMAPVIWDRAEGFIIYDPFGNMWLDWTSGVLAANAGHNRSEVVRATQTQAEKLLFAYAHPTQPRAKLAAKLIEITPPELDRVMFLTGGSETVERAIMLTRVYGRKIGGERKRVIVSFGNAFHGRTLGSLLAGGIPPMKEWLGDAAEHPDFVQVPYPDGFRCEDTSFDLFLRSLKDRNIAPDDVAGVLVESFQGGDANFAPVEYMQKLADWCKQHNIILTLDEIQAGFGRTGKLFGFQQYGIVPDLACFAKGLSGSLPLSAVVGRAELMEDFSPRSMTTTYGANPVCAAAALANIELVINENLPERAVATGKVLHRKLEEIARKHSEIGFVHGKGLVAAVHFVKPGTKEPDPAFAFRVVEACVYQGLMLFAPVGYGGASVKICPPLIITEDAIKEGAELLDFTIEHVKEGCNRAECAR